MGGGGGRKWWVGRDGDFNESVVESWRGNESVLV